MAAEERKEELWVRRLVSSEYVSSVPHVARSADAAADLVRSDEGMSADQRGKFMDQERSGIGQDTRTVKGHSLSLVGRGFFSFVSVFFSFVLSKRAISVMSGLSDILPVKDKKKKKHLSPQL